MEDWKDALAALRGGEELPEEDAASLEESATQAKPRKIPKLQFFYEKKGRAGKPATIIAGFGDMSDDEIADIASMLKKKLGCGGSSRGGEILLQGDRREQARKVLTENWPR